MGFEVEVLNVMLELQVSMQAYTQFFFINIVAIDIVCAKALGTNWKLDIKTQNDSMFMVTLGLQNRVTKVASVDFSFYFLHCVQCNWSAC